MCEMKKAASYTILDVRIKASTPHGTAAEIRVASRFGERRSRERKAGLEMGRGKACSGDYCPKTNL